MALALLWDGFLTLLWDGLPTVLPDSTARSPELARLGETWRSGR